MSPDLILQHDEGWVGVWIMNGITMKDGFLLMATPLPDRQWRIVGPR